MSTYTYSVCLLVHLFEPQHNFRWYTDIKRPLILKTLFQLYLDILAIEEEKKSSKTMRYWATNSRHFPNVDSKKIIKLKLSLFLIRLCIKLITFLVYNELLITVTTYNHTYYTKHIGKSNKGISRQSHDDIWWFTQESSLLYFFYPS